MEASGVEDSRGVKGSGDDLFEKCLAVLGVTRCETHGQFGIPFRSKGLVTRHLSTVYKVWLHLGPLAAEISARPILIEGLDGAGVIRQRAVAEAERFHRAATEFFDDPEKGSGWVTWCYSRQLDEAHTTTAPRFCPKCGGPIRGKYENRRGELRAYHTDGTSCYLGRANPRPVKPVVPCPKCGQPCRVSGRVANHLDRKTPTHWVG